MKKIAYTWFLVCTTAVIGSGTAKAENCMPSDCAALGFNQNKDECAGYNALICPYDLNKHFCSADVCDSMFQYDCKGTGYTSGSGYACNNKYSRCVCSSSYEWTENGCTKCDSSYNLTCNETGYSGNKPGCGGFYSSCTCAGGYCMDEDRKCTKDACKMDYKLEIHFSMPWASCMSYFQTVSWTINANIYDSSGTKLISFASLTITGGEITSNSLHLRSADFSSKIPEGEYKVYLNTSFSQINPCTQFITSSIFIGGNKFEWVPPEGVSVGLYKRNTRAIVLTGEFGSR